MNLSTWLTGVAVAIRHQITPEEITEYLEELEKWRLTDNEWVELKSLVKRRSDFFPRISELEAWAQEVKRNSRERLREPLFETWHDERGYFWARKIKPGQEEFTFRAKKAEDEELILENADSL